MARANVLAVEAAAPGAFNVAARRPHAVGEMARALAVAYGADALPPLVTGEFRLGDVRHVFASPELAARELGFRAEVGFAEGMRAFATEPLRGPVAVR